MCVSDGLITTMADVVVEEDVVDGDVCAICLTTIGTRPRRCVQPCHHAFCLACLRNLWRHAQVQEDGRPSASKAVCEAPRCPLCRGCLTWPQIWTRLPSLEHTSRHRSPTLLLTWKDSHEEKESWAHVRLDVPTVRRCSRIHTVQVVVASISGGVFRRSGKSVECGGAQYVIGTETAVCQGRACLLVCRWKDIARPSGGRRDCGEYNCDHYCFFTHVVFACKCTADHSPIAGSSRRERYAIATELILVGHCHDAGVIHNHRETKHCKASKQLPSRLTERLHKNTKIIYLFFY